MIEPDTPMTSNEVPLLASRTAVPPPPAGFVDRPRLRQALDAATAGPVTLVAGPAGWGKTALLSSWTGTAARSTVWLTVEPGDDRHFWPYLGEALRPVAERDGRAPLPVPPVEPDRAFLVQLADALTRLPEPLVLVLDDFHQIHDPQVLDGVAFLLRHAGSRLRTVVVTRAEPALPVHRWRLSGELTELRASDLSFTAAEAAELMARHGLSVPDTRLVELTRRTEGWPAGLRLAALAMQRHPDPALAAQLSGEDQSVADYLSGEVLAGLPVDLVDAMVSASVLEWMSGGVVDAVTGRTGGEQVLAGLARANAFVVPLGTHPPRYRYHRVFGEFLRARLRRRGGGQERHRRAAGWLAANGLPGDALTQALLAADWGRAGSLFVAHWRELATAGHHRHQPGPLPPPPPDHAVSAEPELALAYAVECLERGEPAAADNQLRSARRYARRLAGEKRDRFAPMAAALRLARAQHGGDPTAVRAAASDLLGLVEPDRPDHGARALAHAALGSAQLDSGDLDRAEATLAAGLADAERSGLSCPRAVCLGRLALVRAMRGRLVAADRTARAAQSLPPCPGQARAVHCAPAELAAAMVHLQWDRTDQAEPHLEAAARLCRPAREPALAAMVGCVRAQLRQRQGDLRAAYAALVAGRRELDGRAVPPEVGRWLAVAEAGLRTARGDTGPVRQLLEPMLPDAGPARAGLCVALARAYLRDGDPGDAATLLPAWEDEATSPAPLGVRVEAGLLDALAARRLGDPRRSASALEQVLQLAEPEGFRLVFTAAGAAVHDLLVAHLDSGTAHWPLVDGLVAATRPGGVPGPAPGPDESLTDRELTVLRYLQSILSTAEIAAELHVSVNTVKTHLRNIYRKLDTTRRREAVRRARELRLV
jgi:LuxR family maltose regulon positive regulatory protein